MKKVIVTFMLPFVGMLVLILDAKTALLGATEGIALCLQTVIPSLFPFLALSSMMISALNGRALGCLVPIERLLKIPAGGAYIWLVGLLGGYPTGARALAEARENGFSNSDYVRMMAFCSNCGPAFIFGLGNHLFSGPIWCWYIWFIHIAASVLVALLTPANQLTRQPIKAGSYKPASSSIEGSVKTMGLICGWIVLFRVLIAFMQRWFLWLMPKWAQLVLLGLLELSNGCTALYTVRDESIRFVLFSVFLGFGGLCVTMQTLNICKDIGMYIPGKVMHGLLSGMMAATVVYRQMRPKLLLFAALLCGLYYFISTIAQKKLDFRGAMLYSRRKIIRGN